jgi:hypothetical protein
MNDAPLGNLHDGDGDGRPQQFKNDGHRGGGWQAKGIEKIEQQDIGDHDRQKYGDQFKHHKKLGMKNAFACHLHHTAGKGDAGQNTQASNDHDGVARGHPGTHRRV